ncbi:MAG: hypothetical protein Q9219_006507 [cf. Caloplaca sp. 3 TL-2023]
MASKAITYVWKIPRPAKDSSARALMAVAYQVAMDKDPNATVVLVRSHVHPSSRRGGQRVKDDPHITVSFKNTEQARLSMHESSHGYTKSMTDWTIIRFHPNNYVKPDNFKDYDGKEIWPEGLDEEVVVHQGPEAA